MVKTITISVVMFVALIGGVLTYQAFRSDANKEYPIIADFSFPDIDGVTRNISEWKGRVIIINFWASWCPPCLEEIPEFIRLQKELAGQGVQFIGIAIEETDPVRQYLSTIEMNYPNLVSDLDGIGLSELLGNSAKIVPFSAVLDRQGRLVHSHPGKFSSVQIRKQLMPLL